MVPDDQHVGKVGRRDELVRGNTMRRFVLIVCGLLTMVTSVATAGPIRGLVDIGTGAEVPDADLRYQGVPTNSPVANYVFTSDGTNAYWAPSAASAPSLQQVTDVGLTTTNGMVIGTSDQSLLYIVTTNDPPGPKGPYISTNMLVVRGNIVPADPSASVGTLSDPWQAGFFQNSSIYLVETNGTGTNIASRLLVDTNGNMLVQTGIGGTNGISTQTVAYVDSPSSGTSTNLSDYVNDVDFITNNQSGVILGLSGSTESVLASNGNQVVNWTALTNHTSVFLTDSSYSNTGWEITALLSGLDRTIEYLGYLGHTGYRGDESLLTSTGNVIYISAGSGFINDSESGENTAISWSATSTNATNFANGNWWIFVDDTEVIQYAQSRQDVNESMHIGFFYVANNQLGTMFDDAVANGENLGNQIGYWMGDFGPFIPEDSGAIVTDPSNTLAVISPQTEYRSAFFHYDLTQNESTNTSRTFLWYNTADLGWVQDTNFVGEMPTNYWNDMSSNAGSALVEITVSNWVSHLVLRTPDDNMHVIYSQQEFGSEADAKGGTIPTIPDAIAGHSVNMAYIALEKGETNINGGIVDIRPLPPYLNVRSSGNGGGGNGATAHGNLTGLANDDHTQYSLVSGARDFSGIVGYDAHKSFSSDTDIIDKKYVDDLLVSRPTTNDSPVMAAGTTWTFSFANVTNVATGGNEVVNWLAMKSYVAGASTVVGRTNTTDGMSELRQSVFITNVAGTVYCEMELIGGGDLTYFFGGVPYTLDCTTGAGTGGRARSYALSVGTDTAPQRSYVYVIPGAASAAVLTNSTTFPSGEFAHAAYVVLRSAGDTLTNGPFALQRTTESLSHSGRGALSYERERIREIGASYYSGVAFTVTDDASGNVTFSTASGVVYQMHRQTFPAFADPATMYVVNDPDIPYRAITNFNQITKDSNGGTWANNDAMAVRVYGYVASGDDGESRLLVMLPTADYNNDSQALEDRFNRDNNYLPAELKGGGFSIARVVMSKSGGGTVSLVSGGDQDVRGAIINSTSGGVGSGVSATEFSDSQFSIFNNTDATKIGKFDASGISASTTRTYVFPDASGTLALQEWVDGTFVGSTNLSILGTVTQGVWQGTAIADGYFVKTGDWTGTFDGQEGSYYLNWVNLTNKSLFAGPGTTGLVTSAGGDTGKFLKADGSWDTPAETPSVYSAATNIDFSASATNDTTLTSLQYSVLDLMRCLWYVDDGVNLPFSADGTFTVYVNSNRHGSNAIWRATMRMAAVRLTAQAGSGTDSVDIDDDSDFAVNDLVYIMGATSEFARVSAVAGDTLTLEDDLTNTHTNDSPIARVPEFGSIDVWDAQSASSVYVRATFASTQTVNTTLSVRYKK